MIRRAQAKDMPGLSRLFKKTYTNNPLLRKYKYFEWQFKHSPGNTAHSLTFFIDGESSSINAHIGFIPVRLMHNGAVSGAILPVNWYAKANISGLRLLSHVTALHDNILQFGMSQDAQAIYSMFKMPILKALPRVIAMIDAKAAVKIFGIRTKKAKATIDKSSRSISVQGETSRITYLKRFNTRDALNLTPWKRIKSFVVRSPAYLNWRYIDIPYHDYKILHNGSKGEFLVYRIEKMLEHPYSVIKILEWSIHERIEGVLTRLIRDNQKHNPVMIEFYCSAHELLMQLTRYGFFYPENILPDKIPDLFRPKFFSHGLCIGIDLPPHRQARTIDFNEWYITKGDGDMDRKK